MSISKIKVGDVVRIKTNTGDEFICEIISLDSEKISEKFNDSSFHIIKVISGWGLFEGKKGSRCICNNCNEIIEKLNEDELIAWLI